MNFPRFHNRSDAKKVIRMNRQSVRKGLSASLMAVFFLATLIMPLLTPAIAAAVDNPQFSLSTYSGRPGLRVEVDQVDACPAIPGGFDYQYVEFTFVDAANVQTVSTYTAGTDSEGSWPNGTIIIIPWRDVLSNRNPIDTTNAAVVGPAAIQARCVLVTMVGDPMNPDDDIKQMSQQYASRPFSVTGPSLEFTKSATTIQAGGIVHLESSDPCPGFEIHGSILSNQGVSNFYIQLDPSSGSWSADVPTVSTDAMTGVTTNFPPGDYEVYAFCMTPTGMGTYSYGEHILEVTGPTPANYVALGDSYSSGEGVEPFETGTYEPGGNMCHRSAQAYPRLLASDTDLPLDLGSNGFAACSGATTAAITLGNNNEGAQMDKITADTDLITMTIGGNNMKFEEFAQKCFWEDCTGEAKSKAMGRIVDNVIPQMEYTLGTIRDRLINLGNSDATVLVVGYPQIVTENPWWNESATGCEWLDGKREAKAIRHVTTHLNTAIKNEVEAIGYDFHFVSATEANSPFAGHELCRDSLVHGMPYFINIVPFPDQQRYSFHPNSRGQEAYAELVKDYLTQHPLN